MINEEMIARAFSSSVAKAKQDRELSLDEKRVMVMEKRITELEAARMAYAREFALNADGEPDVGNIHANIRAMKDALKWLDRWMGHKPLAECAKKIKEVLHAK